MKYQLLLFESTHQVLKAELILKGAGIRHEIIPTPKEISSDCGVSVRIPFEAFDAEKTADLMASAKLNYRLEEKEMR